MRQAEPAAFGGAASVPAEPATRTLVRTLAWLLAPERLAFAVIAFIVWQLAHHALWRDEAQAWDLALASPTLPALFHNLGYEGHPGAWHLLLWLAGQVSHDPAAMKAVHGAIAAATCLVIAYRSPFDRVEKTLLLLSYYVTFEYAVVSRNYGLGLLAILCYARLRDVRGSIVGQFAWLGLAANVNLFALLLSAAIAGLRLPDALRKPARGPAVAGLALYAALAGLALSTMAPAPDHHDARVAAFAWLHRGSMHVSMIGAFSYAASLYAGQGFLPISFDRVPFRFVGAFLPTLLMPLACLPGLVIWGRRDLVFVYATTVAAATVFGFVFLPGDVRHHGIAFVAFVFCYWSMRAAGAPRGRLAVGLLGLNAACGIIVGAASLFHPFSTSAQAAEWIGHHGLRNDYWISAPEFAEAVSAELDQMPLHYAACECASTYIRWRDGWSFPNGAMTDRVLDMMRRDGRDSAWILNSAVVPIDQAAIRADGFAVDRMAAFSGAMVAEEDFVIYHVHRP